MKIRLLSDIHQEFYEDKELYKSQGEDVLVLAGDISAGHAPVIAALKRFQEHQPNIVYLPGNHEYYYTSIDTFDYHLKAFARNSTVKFLNPGTVKFGDVTFIGACGWTNFRKDRIAKMVAKNSITDFSVISGFTTDIADQLHTEHFQYIFEAYHKLPGKKVIVTHFLPAIECISDRFKGPELINYYFANDYGNAIALMQDTTWLFGHTHDSMDIMLDDTRLIANPYGYNRNPNYKECILEV